MRRARDAPVRVGTSALYDAAGGRRLGPTASAQAGGRRPPRGYGFLEGSSCFLACPGGNAAFWPGALGAAAVAAALGALAAWGASRGLGGLDGRLPTASVCGAALAWLGLTLTGADLGPRSFVW